MKLFAGLGNPGEKYAGNRHNIGFLAVDRIAGTYRFSPWRKKFQGLIADGELGGERVTLIKPQTYMNESGQAVGEALRFLKLGESDVYVFHDELDLAPGKIKVKSGGGNAGHNGLRSISAHIGNDYCRVRLGIGHPGSKDAVAPYVLNDFATSERTWLNDLLNAIAAAAPHLATGHDARFLSDVALRLQTGDQTIDAPANASLASQSQSKLTKTSHPAGERASKRSSALADNLKKWLAGRKSD